MNYLPDRDGSAVGTSSWEPEDFSFETIYQAPVRTVWDAGGDESVDDPDRDDTVPGPPPVFSPSDFVLPPEVAAGPAFDAWAAFDFKAPSVYDPPSVDPAGRWIDRRSVTEMALEIVATAPPSMSHRRGPYAREIERFLHAQVAPPIAFRLLARTAADVDGDLLMDAVRFRNVWDASDWRLRRTRSREAGWRRARAVVSIVRDDKPLYWPQALRFAEMLEGRDPESVVNERTCEEWTASRDVGSDSWWRLVEFACSVFHPDGPGLVPDPSVDVPRFACEGPPIVTTYQGFMDFGISKTGWVETVVSVGEPGRRVRAASPAHIRTQGSLR